MDMQFKIALKAVLLALCLASHAYAAPSEIDARAYAEKSFASKWIKCPSQSGLRYLVLLNGRTLTELSKPWLAVTSSDLSEADHLNGIDFTGQVQLRLKAFRTFSTETGRWNDWEVIDTTALAMGLPSPFVDYGMLIQHRSGQWQTLNNTVDSTANLDCDRANSIESAPPHAAAAAKPFSANAVLNGDMLSTKCRVPKGTQVMVVGHSFAYSEAYPKDSVVIDPAVCPSTTLNVPVELINALPGSERELARVREPPTSPAQAFTPNNHLNQDFETKAFEGSCLLPKGTAVQDLGLFENWRKLYREPMERIILPPDACKNLPPSNNRVLPVSVLESKSAEATAPRVVSQMPIAPPQRIPSFMPNGVLLREWRWGTCVFPKGMRLQDLGHQEGLPDSFPMDSVIMDPAAGCLSARGSGGPIGVSKSAIGAIP